MLLCADGSFYVGITSSPDCRIAQHNLGIDRKSYTFTRRPVRLVHMSEFRYVHDAIHWEKHFKGWSHAKKQALAENDWRTVQGLAKGKWPGHPSLRLRIALRCFAQDRLSAQDDKGVLRPSTSLAVLATLRMTIRGEGYQMPNSALTSSEAIVRGSHGGVNVISTLAFFTPSTAST